MMEEIYYSVFIDNIPDKATHLWLRKVFNYGVLRDAYIPF